MLTRVWQPRRLLSWLVLGGAAAVAELVLVALLYEGFDWMWGSIHLRAAGLGWPLPLATAVAAEALILVKFVVADRWVFGHPSPTLDRLVRYHGASLGALIAYWLVANACVLLLGMPLALAFGVGTAVAFVWSLATNFLWVWAAPRAARAPATAEHSRTGPPA